MMQADRSHEAGIRLASHLTSLGLRNKAVLDAIAATPRARFIPEGFEELAYEDLALPISCGQTISQPFVVARMLELATPGPKDKALEIGAGSGYAAAVLGRLCREVYAVERWGPLARLARERMATLKIDNVSVLHADGMAGDAVHAPFDVIIVSAGGRDIPPALLEQLAPGGRLVAPLGDDELQHLTLIRRTEAGAFERTRHDGVTFVPLVPNAA